MAKKCKSYLDPFLYQEYPNDFETTDKMEGPVDCITVDEVKKAMISPKDGKAAGLSEVTKDIFKLAL